MISVSVVLRAERTTVLRPQDSQDVHFGLRSESLIDKVSFTSTIKTDFVIRLGRFDSQLLPGDL